MDTSYIDVILSNIRKVNFREISSVFHTVIQIVVTRLKPHLIRIQGNLIPIRILKKKLCIFLVFLWNRFRFRILLLFMVRNIIYLIIYIYIYILLFYLSSQNHQQVPINIHISLEQHIPIRTWSHCRAACRQKCRSGMFTRSNCHY